LIHNRTALIDQFGGNERRFAEEVGEWVSESSLSARTPRDHPQQAVHIVGYPHSHLQPRQIAGCS
jgi:hypothetical protein